MLDVTVAEGLFITWDFVVLILTATTLGFIAHKTKQPTIIAYILAGLILGPVGFEMIGETHFTELLSELGLVFLLFLIGLEIKLDEIRKILKPTTIIGTIQIALTFAAGFLTSLLLNFSLMESAFIGAAVMFSSTALVVKLLADNDESSTLPGRLDVGVLLIQDIVVVLLLALIGTGMGNLLSVAIKFLEVVVFIAIMSTVSILFSKYVLPRIFEKIEGEMHTLFIYGVAWAFTFIAIAQNIGISMEIGAFIAGLGLAQLPRTTELRERVRPLTNLFMAIFFINFGLTISLGQLSALFFEAIAASILLIGAKFLIFFVLIDKMKFTPETSFVASINMTQISEFGLILASLALTKGFIGEEIVGFLSIVAIVTMGSSSYLINYNRKIYEKLKHLFSFLEWEGKEGVEIRNLRGHAIIIGYDEITRRLIPVLKGRYGDVVVIDKNPKHIDSLEKSEGDFVFGDLKHGEMRRSAGLKHANIIISLARDEAVNRRVLEGKKADAITFLRSKDREEAAELYDLGADFVIIKRMLSGEKMGEYIEDFLQDPETFRKKIEGDKQIIDWEARL